MRNITLPRIAKHLLMIDEELGFRVPYEYNKQDIIIKMFEQMWGSASGGFEGIGGCAMTTQMTCVIYNRQFKSYHIFFDGRFAYSLEDGNYNEEMFIEDLKNESIKGLESSKKYRRK